MIRLVLTFFTVIMVFSNANAQSSNTDEINPDYTIVARYPHDVNAFTQGLIFEDGYIYESTGRYGKSEIRKVDLTTGEVLKSIALPGNRFGEGLASQGDNLVSLTWRSGEAYIWDKENFAKINQSKIKGEGWGLTFDGEFLIMSNGKSELRFLDPKSLKLIKKIKVRENGKKVKNINELEYIEGKVFANIWKKSKVAIIDPKTGNVDKWLDLSALVSEVGTADVDAVLNGIAFDKETHRLFITGKMWPNVYEIKLHM